MPVGVGEAGAGSGSWPDDGRVVEVTTWLSIQPRLQVGQRGTSSGRGVPQNTQGVRSAAMAGKHTVALVVAPAFTYSVGG